MSVLEPTAIELGKEIGRGSQGIVYEAKHENQLVAVKKFNLNTGSTSKADFENDLRKIETEINAYRACQHPHLLRLIGVIKETTQFADGVLSWPKNVIVEYCDGGDLRDYISTRWGDRRMLRFTDEVCQGLIHMHGKRLFHRDVKPTNVLLHRRANLHAKLGDFGLAAVADLYDHTSSTGTRLYKAPENSTGNRKYGPKVDIYSVGCMLWFWMKNAEPKVHHDQRTEELEEWIKERHLEPSHHYSPCPLFPHHIVKRCLDEDPESRPQLMEIQNEMLKAPQLHGGVRVVSSRTASFGSRYDIPKGTEGVVDKIDEKTCDAHITFHGIGTVVCLVKDFGDVVVAQASPLLAEVAGFLRISVQDLKAESGIDLNCKPVHDGHVKEIARHCANLTVIYLTNCYKVTDVSIKELARGCPNLKEINLAECRDVTDIGVKELARGCPNLTTIDLRWTAVTDCGVKELSNCRNLERIVLDGTKVTDPCIQEILQKLSNVTRCSIENTPAWKGVGKLREKFPHVKFD